MKISKIIIPKIEDIEKIYLYRSMNANDINTISKVSKLQPILIIDTAIASTEIINDQECYIVQDTNNQPEGITYNGPNINSVPINEYETDINLVMLNTFTPINELILSPLEISQKQGIVFYYSIIGVNESTDQMTHLSKVNASLVPYTSKEDVTREIWSCDDLENPEWKLVNSLPYNEADDKIRIGDITRPYNIQRLGIPFSDVVPKIQEVNVSLNSLISDTFMVLEIQNPWQNNNKDFNYRKLKSYKIRNVYDSVYGEFSVPTYQSELPVSIEKMVIKYKENPDDKNAVIDINDNESNTIEIIRRNGLYYNNLEHKSLGYNQWNIPLERNSLSVYSESSVQDTINIQVSAVAGNIYSFDIYLMDAYQNTSENTHYIIET